MAIPKSSRKIFRLDSFQVPQAARAEFLARVRQTHELLRRQSGFVQDRLLEKPATEGKFILVTMVEWQSPESVALAREAVAIMHRETGFNPQVFLARLGIEAEIGNFTEIET
ncbi:antibiotic biosynthesis monooxygenase [Microbulbifer taiwanensis]|uniref:Antibiotic biosynthesis monooxygenase family protein n=2 Tax=Microbulbifer taiwanensis TaxID=986746 RepID=A0ABW1YNK9_9GAMM